MNKFIYFEDSSSDPLEAAPDYSKLLYEYMVNQDNLQVEIQEETNAAYVEKLEAINMNLSWCVALLVFFLVLFLYRNVRGWVTMLTGGGLKDVL